MKRTPTLWFITGTDTGIGKTMITRALAAGMRARGLEVLAVKPFETGCTPLDGRLVGEDALALAQAAGRPDAETGLVRFEPPLGPSVAARMAGQPIDLNRALEWIHARAAEVDHLLVEGVGGLMVPLTDRETVVDWIRMIQPAGVVLVTRNRLGVLSQALTAAHVLRSEGLPLQGVVLNAGEGEPGLPERTNQEELERWLRPVVPFPALTPDVPLSAPGEQLARSLGLLDRP